MVVKARHAARRGCSNPPSLLQIYLTHLHSLSFNARSPPVINLDMKQGL